MMSAICHISEFIQIKITETNIGARKLNPTKLLKSLPVVVLFSCLSMCLV